MSSIPKTLDAATGPRRRLTLDRTKQTRINLTRGLTPTASRNNNNHFGRIKSEHYDDDFLIDAHNDAVQAPPSRRRAVHFNDINSQETQSMPRKIEASDTFLYLNNNSQNYERADEPQFGFSQSSSIGDLQPMGYTYDSSNTINAVLKEDPERAKLEEELKRLRWREKNHMEVIRRLKDEQNKSQRLLEDITTRYQTLKNIKVTETEQTLTDLMVMSQTKDDAYVEVRDQAESIIEKYTAATVDNTLEQPRTEHQPKLPLANQTPDSDTSALKEKLFEELTGSIIKRVKHTKDGLTYACIIAGDKGSFLYTLTFAKDDMIYYSPKIDSQDTELLAALPDVFKENIEFKKMYLPSFYANLSKFLHYVEEDDSQQQQESQQKDA